MLENIKIIREEQNNLNFDPNVGGKSNGGNYDQPFVEYSFTRNGKEYSCIVDDKSCGDFGRRIDITVYDGKEPVYSYDCDFVSNYEENCMQNPHKFDDSFLLDVENMTGYDLISEKDLDLRNIHNEYNLKFSQQNESLDENISPMISTQSFNDFKDEVISYCLKKNIEKFNESENKDFDKFSKDFLKDTEKLLNERLMGLSNADYSCYNETTKEYYLVKKADEFGLKVITDDNNNKIIENFIPVGIEWEDTYKNNLNSFLKEKINSAVVDAIDVLENIKVNDKGYIEYSDNIDVSNIEEYEENIYHSFEILMESYEDYIKIGEDKELNISSDKVKNEIIEDLKFEFVGTNSLTYERIEEFSNKYKEKYKIDDFDKYKEKIFNEKYIKEYGKEPLKDENFKKNIKDKEINL